MRVIECRFATAISSVQDEFAERKRKQTRLKVRGDGVQIDCGSGDLISKVGTRIISGKVDKTVDVCVTPKAMLIAGEYAGDHEHDLLVFLFKFL